MVKGCRLVLLLGLIVVPALARGQTARAFVNERDVVVNRQFVLNIEISGTQQLDEDPIPPDLSSFARYLGSGTSSSMQVVNGRTSVSLTIQYRYLATTPGSFEIGPITVRAGGQSFRTEPVPISVTDAPPPSAGRRDPNGDGTVAPDDLFLTASVNPSRVFVNEPVVVEYRLYTRVSIDGYSVTDLPRTDGFWVEELDVPQDGAEQVVRDGQRYATVVVRRVALFPTRAGRTTLEPLTIETQVRVRRRSRSLFDDPFFGDSLFGSRIPLAVASDPVEIEVRPLPPGQPDSFSGLAGQLHISGSVDRTSARVNEALTYRLDVTGTANTRVLEEPALEFPPELEVYPPEVAEHVEPANDSIRVSKTFEYVVVPRSPGDVTIPAVEVSYFDSEREAYVVATTDPIRLTIAGDAIPSPPMPTARIRTPVDLDRQHIRFIRLTTSEFQPIDASLFRSLRFWGVVLLPMVGVAGAIAVRRQRDRLRGDVAYARRRRASRIAKERMAEAARLQSPTDHREFHAAVGRALQGFLADMLNVSEAGLIRDDARTQLLARFVPPDVVDGYLACLEECDRGRFAPIEPDAAAMQDMLARAERVMTALAQAVR